MHLFCSLLFSQTLLTRHDEDLREPLVRRQGSQVSMRVASAWVYLWVFYLVPLGYISVFVSVPYCLDVQAKKVVNYFLFSSLSVLSLKKYLLSIPPCYTEVPSSQ